MQKEIKMTIKESELIITDKYGTDMILTKYKTTDGMGVKRERIQLMPAEAGEYENADMFTVDMPVEDFNKMIDLIKNIYLIDGKEIELEELK